MPTRAHLLSTGGAFFPGDVKADTINGIQLWQGLLTQASTGVPTATVLRNDLGGTITWSYDGVGIYTGTLTGGFVAGKTAIDIQPDALAFIVGKSNGADSFTIKTYNNSGTLANDLMAGTYLEIKVFNSA